MNHSTVPHLKVHWLPVILTCVLCVVESSHFRGATVQWRPVNSNGSAFNGEIEITHRISYSRTYGCDDTQIAMRTLLGGSSDYLICRLGCVGNVGTMQFYCTDFSVEDNWSAGQRTYSYDTGGVTYFEASYTGGAWATLASGGSSWEVRVKGNLSIREDTGRVNSSPTTVTFPGTNLIHGCNHTLVIPGNRTGCGVQDIDGDIVRCRWAVGDECADVCESFNATLSQEKCELQYEATGLVGLYAVALQVEDFASPNDTEPLSSVPLQFLVRVTELPGISCDTKPELVGETPIDGTCIGVALNETYEGRIVARAVPGSSITEIVTISPPGLRRSQLTGGTGVEEWFIDITWTPDTSLLGPNILCFMAQDTLRIFSSQSCITFLGGVDGPTIIPESLSPRGLVNLTDTSEWTLEFDTPFRKPSASAHITIFNRDGMEVFSIDVSVSEDVTYPELNSTQVLTFRVTNTTFIAGMTYYVTMNSGVAISDGLCDTESPILLDSTVWNISIIVPDPCLSEPCDPNANCVRDGLLNSNFTCTCNVSFIGDGFNCTKPDPCLSDPCDINADCKREGLLSELFNCTCIPPFEGTGFNCSIPDPCLSEPCDPNANCVRDGLLNSNFTCTCNPEFTGDGFNCTVPDPCIRDSCDMSADCKREGLLSDLFNCTCRLPFVGDGFNCSIPDPCLNKPCDENATCTRERLRSNNFTCHCVIPFVGDGFNCSIPDPCLAEPCDVNATCMREGLRSESFECECFGPYFGDGFNCTEIGPLETYRIVIISVPAVLGAIMIVLLVGILYGYIKIVGLFTDAKKQSIQPIKQSLL